MRSQIQWNADGEDTWVRASADQEGSGEDRLAPSAVHTLSWKINFGRLSSGLCATVLERFFQSRGRSYCGLASLMLMPGIHVCWAPGMEDFQCTDKLLAVPTEGHTLGPQSMPQLWGKCEGLHLGAKDARCQRHLYSRGHCGRASGQAAPSGGQGHPHSHEACSKLFCSSSSVCNQLQSRDWKSKGRLKIQQPPIHLKLFFFSWRQPAQFRRKYKPSH